MESWWTPETSESDLKGQNLMACGVLYNIGKLLERRCQKGLALLIWTSETQVMAKRRVESQIGNEKVKNRPDLLSCRQRATYRWKALNESYNFALERTSIRGLLAKLWGSKFAGVPIGANSGLPCGSPGREKPFGCGPRGEVQSIL